MKFGRAAAMRWTVMGFDVKHKLRGLEWPADTKPKSRV
jgi:hypothetical protein